MGIVEIAEELMREHGARGYEIAAVNAVESRFDGLQALSEVWLAIAETCRTDLRSAVDLGAFLSRDVLIARRGYDAQLAELAQKTDDDAHSSD